MKPNFFNRIVNQQDGSMIMIALMVMAILSVTGAYAINIATTGQQATTNVEIHKAALYNAEAGAQYALAQIQADLNDEDNSIEEAQHFIDANGQFIYDTQDFDFDLVPEGDWTGNGPYRLEVIGNDPWGRDAEFEIEVTFNIDSLPLPAYNVGMLSDGDIDIQGSPEMEGSLHANGNLSQKGGGGFIEGSVSAAGTVSVGTTVTGENTPNADRIDIDPIDFEDWRGKADIDTSQGDPLPDFKDDMGGQIVYVDGDLDIDGDDMSNVTIIATGDITVDGSSKLTAGDGISNFIISGGDIEFNGSADWHGIFRSEGTAVWNGSGTIIGSIVSSGAITRNGQFKFEFNDNLENENIPKERKVSPGSWADQGLIS